MENQTRSLLTELGCQLPAPNGWCLEIRLWASEPLGYSSRQRWPPRSGAQAVTLAANIETLDDPGDGVVAVCSGDATPQLQSGDALSAEPGGAKHGTSPVGTAQYAIATRVPSPKS